MLPDTRTHASTYLALPERIVQLHVESVPMCLSRHIDMP